MNPKPAAQDYTVNDEEAPTVRAHPEFVTESIVPHLIFFLG